MKSPTAALSSPSTSSTGCVISVCSPTSDGGGGQTAAGKEAAINVKLELDVGEV
jgi:hypothetical protein